MHEKRRASGFWLCMAVVWAGCEGSIDRFGSGHGGNAGDAPGTGGTGGPAGTGGSEGTDPKNCTVKSGAPVDFFRDIQPILADSCVRCHGGVRLMPPAPLAPLDLQKWDDPHTRELVGPGHPDTSKLLDRVTGRTGLQLMPLNAPPLNCDQIDKLTRWIAAGATWPKHWAFGPLVKPDPAQVVVSDEKWVRVPEIDRFILNRLDQQGIKPSPEADPSTLIRRVSLDLTGLPPTPPEVAAFLADASPVAYEALVDRLLASPNFGERWARHWLDQARYADSNGYAQDGRRDEAYKWRDWVIGAFNRDMKFDTFTLSQMAGDIAGSGGEALATGFHTQTMFNGEGGTKREEDRNKRVIDRVATIGQTWLGLTLGCTQCHGHPYDPIGQKEFYRLFAFFNNADEVPAYDDDKAGNSIYEEKTLNLIGERNDATVTTDITIPMGSPGYETRGRRKTYRLLLANYLNPDKTEELTPGTPAVLHGFTARNAAQPDRLDLAHWLVDKANPLTPRVTVNTIWYHLFGQGIVTSLDDFGARATFPTHPELLERLASDFQGHWSRKTLIKRIVLSAAYRQASVFRPDLDDPVMGKDPGNSLVHRQNRVRVEAEIVWDLFLAAGGLLCLPPCTVSSAGDIQSQAPHAKAQKVGGPSTFPPIPQDLLDLFYGGPGGKWDPSPPEERFRRGLYVMHYRNVPYPSLHAFDLPEADASAAGRPHSDTALQALTTLHNEVFVEAAQAFAKRVQTTAPGSLDEQLDLAFRIALARPPAPAELALFKAEYEDSKRLFNAQQAARAVGTHAPPGVAAVDAAAWVATARMILNLDEFIMRD